MQPRRDCIASFLLPLVFFVVALLTIRPGWCAAETGDDEVRRLEASLRSMEDTLRLRQQEEAGGDPETIRLQRKVEAARMDKDTSYGFLTKVRDIQRRANNDPTATPSELADVDSLVQKAEDDWNRAEQSWVNAENSLAAHRHRILHVRSREVPISTIKQQCESLRLRLASARQGSQSVRNNAPPLPTSSWSGETIILSEEQARIWLRRNGYLGAGDVPTARFRDWQSRLHSSLDRSNHPLQGMSGRFYYSRDGRLMGPIHIVVKPGAGNNGTGNNGTGSGNGGQERPGGGGRPAEAPVDESSRDALLAKLRDAHARWYAAWCRKTWSGCAIVPNGVRDELRQWIKKSTKQRQIDRCEKLLACYDSCVMKRPTSESQVNQCTKRCKDSIK